MPCIVTLAHARPSADATSDASTCATGEKEADPPALLRDPDKYHASNYPPPSGPNTLELSGRERGATFSFTAMNEYPHDPEADAKQQLGLAPGEELPGAWKVGSLAQTFRALAAHNPPDSPVLHAIVPDFHTSSHWTTTLRELFHSIRMWGVCWGGPVGKRHLSNLTNWDHKTDAIGMRDRDGNLVVVGCDLRVVSEFEATVRPIIEEAVSQCDNLDQAAFRLFVSNFHEELRKSVGYGTLTRALRARMKSGSWFKELEELTESTKKGGKPKKPRSGKDHLLPKGAVDDLDGDSDEDDDEVPWRGGMGVTAATHRPKSRVAFDAPTTVVSPAALQRERERERDALAHFKAEAERDRAKQAEMNTALLSALKDLKDAPSSRGKIEATEHRTTTNTRRDSPERRASPRRSPRLSKASPPPARRTGKPTPDSYDRERGGSKFSKFACYAYMFDKNGCPNPDKCSYSHKRRVIADYRKTQNAKKADDKDKGKKAEDEERDVDRRPRKLRLDDEDEAPRRRRRRDEDEDGEDDDDDRPWKRR